MYRVKATLPIPMPTDFRQSAYTVLWRRVMRIMGLAGQPIYEHGGGTYALTTMETIVTYKGLKKILDGWRDYKIEMKLEITQEPEADKDVQS